jgi:hypothetical protein
MFGDSWTGNEIRDAEAELPSSIPSVDEAFRNGEPIWGVHREFASIIRKELGLIPLDGDPAAISTAEWRVISEAHAQDRLRIQLARQLRNDLVQFCTERALMGDLAFAYRTKVSGGTVVSLKADAWQIDYPWVPFATLGMDPQAGLATLSPTAWLFVTESSLDDLVHATSGSAIAIAKSSSGAERNAVKVLKAAFASDDYPPAEWPKREFWSRMFQGEISARSFERAWAEAAREYPKRAAKGRRKGT